MKVLAPFQVHEVSCDDRAQAPQTRWFLAGLGLQRVQVFDKFPRSKSVLAWGYWRQSLLGRVLSGTGGREVWRPL